MKKTIFLFLALVMSCAFSADAALVNRGGGLIYDTVLDVTWLQDANYAQTSGYDEDGKMIWQDAVAWAEQLVYSGYNDWRLPNTVNVDYAYGYDGSTSGGFSITSSEMGYMFYENLGGIPYRVSATETNDPYGFTSMSPFLNLQKRAYWSGTDYLNHTSDHRAWAFNFDDGSQGYQQYSVLEGNPPPVTYAEFNAWAVRDGDVTHVPIPGAVWLLGTGLVVLSALRRRLI